MQPSPKNAEHLKNLGNAYKAAGDLQAAIDSFRRSLEAAPAYVPALYNLALCLRELNVQDEAEQLLRRILQIDPDDGDVLFHLGSLLHEQSRLTEAIPVLRSALRHKRENPLLWLYLGIALARQYNLEEAAACLRRANELDPDLADANFFLGNVYSLLGKRDAALRFYQIAQNAVPDNPSYRAALLSEMQHVCDWSRFDVLCDSLLQSISDRPPAPIQPFSLISIRSTRAEQMQCARNFSQSLWRSVARDRERLGFHFRRGAAGKIRIGYLSGDFHEHATAYLAAELFELHDRGRFEVNAYSYGPGDPSPTRSRLRLAFDRFTDVSALSNAEAAEAIHADGVDILVDLKGYTQYARPEIMAMRPAPIQVNFLGYPGTMGAEFIDYVVGDRFVTPLAHAGDYSEKLVLLPGTYQVNDRKRVIGATPSRRELGLPERCFVFCCFNQPYKILPDTFAVWLQLLKASPNSVLWMLEGNTWAAENLRLQSGKYGVGSDRLLFAPIMPLDRHLGRLRAADLFLDTFPCNAHTTASDALWTGLPVLTCSGATFASRVAGSLLTAIGLPELITHSMTEYQALALRLAQAPHELAGLRDRLCRNRATSAIFDTPRFAGNLETAYERMWQNYVAGMQPREIEIADDASSAVNG